MLFVSFHLISHGVARGAVGLHADTKLATRLAEVDPFVANCAVATLEQIHGADAAACTRRQKRRWTGRRTADPSDDFVAALAERVEC